MSGVSTTLLGVYTLLSFIFATEPLPKLSFTVEVFQIMSYIFKVQATL